MAPWLVRVQHECALEVRGHAEAVDRALLVEQAPPPPSRGRWLSRVVLIDAGPGDHGARAQALARAHGRRRREPARRPSTGTCWRPRRGRDVLGDREAAALLYTSARAERPAVPGRRPRRHLPRLGAVLRSRRLAHALGRLDEAELRLRRAVTENLRIGAARAPRSRSCGSASCSAARPPRPRHAARRRRAGGRAAT